MKKMLLATLALTGAFAASADSYTYPYICFQKADSSVVALGVNSLEITFSDGKLVATNAETTRTLSVADLSRMYFSADDTGIDDLPTGVNFPDSETSGKASVYTPAGVLVGTYSTLTEAKAAAKGGVYIIRQNGKTLKVTAK